MITIISQKFYLKLGIVIIYASFSESLAAAQLNLPPLPIFSTARPDIYPNSYAANRPNDRYNFDNDRSQRYGPPYRDDEEERYGDRRPNNNYDDRNRYNTGANDRDRNPFNNTYDRYKPNDGYRPENPYNQNPYNENPNTYNQNPFNDRDRNTYNNTYDRYKPNDRYGPDHPYNQNPYNQNPNTYNQNPYNSERYNQVLERLRHFLVDADHKGSIECTTNVGSQWNFETDVNEVTQAEALLAQQRYSDYLHIIWEELNKIDKDNIFDENLARQVKLLAAIGPSALPPDQLDRYNRVINDMLAIYNGATICEFERPFECGLRLQPHLKDIMAKSRDWNELQYVWSEYRRKSGKPMRDLFQQLIELMNDIAVANNYTSPTEYWFSAYETPNFRDEMQLVWSQIQPLYELLHAYVRRKLREYYGPDKINRNAPLPAHIFGNMYAQTWTNILDIIIPYPGRSFIDVTPRMLEQGYTPSIMFQLAEEFFLSMNMSALSPDFWVNSILEEPVNRPVLCQPSSWDFCTRHDFRIKMCTHVTHKDLINVHHEMAHIQYFLNYRHQPKVFRDGANPGFHEAIGDAIGLSVSTAKHLQTLGLVQKSVDDTSYDINFLFAMAVDKVVFLPYALTTEIWRADIFNRRVSKAEYNCYYWLLREQYSGIKPPILRSEIDFDPGAKYHIPANVPYMKYFVGTVLQFQIYRALCRASRQYDPNNPQKPLHKCDIYRQPEAGNILRKIMEKGASQPWQKILEEAIGESRLDGSALREYFRPLEDWLRSENLRNQEFVGWSYDGDYCKHSLETANLQVIGTGFYNAANKKAKNFGVSALLLLILKFICY